MDEGFPPEIEIFRSIVMKITKLQLHQIIREEIIDWQGKYNDDFKFKTWTSSKYGGLKGNKSLLARWVPKIFKKY